MVKFFVSAFVILFLFGLSSEVDAANTMSSLDYHIELQEDGSGVITETRQMYLTEDTEIYIVMENLGGSEVLDFHVSDFDEPLTYEPDWDINASREEKAGKYGIVQTSQGQELSWGIGEYGEHEYTVTYTITDMVRQLEDGQGMNWRLFDGHNNINPKEVTLTITGPRPFTVDDTRIWGFGFDGEVYLENGKLVGWSNTALSDQNHITILMHYLNEPFEPRLSLDQTLSEQEMLAKEGSSYNEDSSTDIIAIILSLVIGGFFLFTFVMVLGYGVFYKRALSRERPLITGRKRRAMNEDKYARDVPYPHAPMTDVAYLLQQVDKGKEEHYFGAFILKWIKEGRLAHTTKQTGKLKKKETSKLEIKRDVDLNAPPLEQKFWDIISAAAGSDSVLDEKKLKKWAEKNYKQIEKVKNEIPIQSKKHLIDRGYLKTKMVKVMKIFPVEIIEGTTEGEDLFNHLVQFENYLADFSLLDEREINEVLLWEDLLIWASLYGRADQVAEQLKQFYPQHVNDTSITYTDIYLMSMFSRSFSSGYTTGLSASSGGGGATSFGGGGGSFGGGGGGSR